MDKASYKKVALDDVETAYAPVSTPSSPVAIASSPSADHSNRQSIQFAKSAFVFRDNLEAIRKKRNSTLVSPTPLSAPSTPAVTSEKTPAAASTVTTAELVDETPTPPESPIITRRLRLLRLVQSTLTAILSIVVASLQIRAYADFQRTKNVAGAWPAHANILPTLLLFGVALTAATFDLALLGAYAFPKAAPRLLSIAVSAHTLLTTIKGVSYALTSVVCRGGFNFGNESGQNDDLWSWTCSPKADAMESVNNAPANCDGQTAAWYLAMAQVAIEALGTVGTTLIKQNTKKKEAASKRSAAFDAEFNKVADLEAEFEDSVAEYTPKFETKK